MKKLNILAIIVVLSFSMSALANPPALKNRTDSLNYAFGLLQSGNIKMYLQNDSTGEQTKSFLQGVDKAMKKGSKYIEMEGIGANIGQNLKMQNETGLLESKDLTVNIELIKQGLINGLYGFDEQMNSGDAQMYVRGTMQQIEEKKMEELYGENRREGEEFLAENKTKPGVVTTESGLQYKVVKTGKGKKPTATDKVKVHYHGTLIDGTVFDSSINRGEPITFGVSQVIAGWTEALKLMPVGSKWILYIPQELAYGTRDMGTIQPYSALIFEVELLGIE
ncbi:FKBP-type peptidyl-prolyl cis-trans isomerase [Paludibacter sp. 221]|uniref:FKBP-type peptidyl-prolyl cis-trans isomerase n=1 Tax=Paludibacter sp. 221 TaxID=2302939 RepID=UPI0013D34903|nr:FKBP-type peptidyl-prolyl cis-trans isomerase [Paludibacter sp. 221]NDV46821.1 FKBP-type peptidyl-prolyl cis-trans isomerase [Paludibacter sp. 221]